VGPLFKKNPKRRNETPCGKGTALESERKPELMSQTQPLMLAGEGVAIARRQVTKGVERRRKPDSSLYVCLICMTYMQDIQYVHSILPYKDPLLLPPYTPSCYLYISIGKDLGSCLLLPGTPPTTSTMYDPL